MNEVAAPSRPVWPPSSLEELERAIHERGYLGAARFYGVSRATLKERALRLGIRSPYPTGVRATRRATGVQQHPGPEDKGIVVSFRPPSKDTETLLSLLRSGPVSLAELADRFDRGPATVRRWLDALRTDGYQVVERGGGWLLADASPAPAETETRLEPRRGMVRFGVVSDTHLGSRYARLDVLHDLYRRFADEGITDVYHTGDLLDGHGMYRGQEWEQDVHGFDAQVAYTVEHYPRVDGVRTHIIGGNHDTSYLKSTGADPLVRVTQLRDDIEYLGPYSAWVNVTERFRAYLVHPDGGPAYARSYKLQKLIESFQGGRKPNLLIAGHWHEWVVLFERNVWAMLAGCVQDQTDYMRRKALQPKVGGTTVTVRLDRDGAIQSFEPRFVAYLVPEAVDEGARAA